MSEAANLAAKLEAQGSKPEDFMLAIEDDDWKREVYTDGAAWTVRSILAHLMTSEKAFLKLFLQIADGGPGVSDDFVIDRSNASQQRRTASLRPEQLLQQYVAARADMVTFVAGLGDSDLEVQGRHPFLGLVSLRDMVKMIYIHNQSHCRDIRRVLGA